MSNCENRTYTVEDIAKILNIGRSAAYNLTKEGHFKIVRIGNAIGFQLPMEFYKNLKLHVLRVLNVIYYNYLYAKQEMRWSLWVKLNNISQKLFFVIIF